MIRCWRAPAVCAEFERQHGRAPAAADLLALAELGAALAREYGAAASVVDGALLEEYVALGDQELPPVRCAAVIYPDALLLC